jgi:hypothetical protein
MYVPPPHLADRFHFVLDDSRPWFHRDTVLVYDPRPLKPYKGLPGGPAVWGVLPGDPRYVAAALQLKELS